MSDIVAEATRILEAARQKGAFQEAEFFFRGESLNYQRKEEGGDLPLAPAFPCYLDRKQTYITHEGWFYREAMRLHVASFETDRTMVERVGRMQHFQVPTRFCDLSSNVLMAAMFACGGGELLRRDRRDNGHDGYIRVMKVSKARIKSFTSDIIHAIAHLPLVKRELINPSQETGLDHLRYEIANSRPGFEMEIGSSSGNLLLARDQLREEIQHVWAFKPIWNSERIRVQEGIFLAFGCHDNKEPLNPTFSLADYDNPAAPSYGIAQVDYIQIHADCKRHIREELRHFGVPLENVYPDLSNASLEIELRLTQETEV